MKKPTTFAVHTLGCKLNQAESETLARDLAGRGDFVGAGNEADAFIINTCSVTHAADRKARHLVRMLRMRNPRSRIIVTGCGAGLAGEALCACGADLAVANTAKMAIPELLADWLPEKAAKEYKPGQLNATDRVRSFIKIQDGCRNFCAYCIVPLVRGRVYCISAGEVVAQIGARVRDGYREAVLTGTEVGSYDSGGSGLTDLVGSVLRKTHIERLRLSSLQPQHITRELLDLWQNNRMCRHFHIALQSGSDPVLQRMRRSYDTNLFRRALDLIRSTLPDASVTTDIMVGFPGESDEEFAESYEFCELMGFAAIHVFPFSARPGPAAAGMTGKVSEKTKRQRSRAMLDLAARSADRFSAGFTGKAMEVLWESEVRKGSGVYSGLTGNYIRVYADSREDISNSVKVARLASPAVQAAGPVLRPSTRGNHGELWSMIIR